MTLINQARVTGHKFGAIPDPPDIRDRVYQPKLTRRQAATRLPDSFDLGRRKIMPPTLDQGNLGSCVWHAVPNAIRFTLGEQHSLAFLPSRLAGYYQTRLMEGTAEWDSGCFIRDALKVANRQGVAPEELWEYDITRFDQAPPPSFMAEAERHQILKYERVPQDMQVIKEVLHGGDPIVIGIAVYESFETAKVASTGTVPMPKSSETLLGWHAVGVYRYTKTRVGPQNSWGASWGNNGEFTLPWNYVLNPDLADDFWRVIAVEDPAVKSPF